MTAVIPIKHINIITFGLFKVVETLKPSIFVPDTKILNAPTNVSLNITTVPLDNILDDLVRIYLTSITNPLNIFTLYIINDKVITIMKNTINLDNGGNTSFNNGKL